MLCLAVTCDKWDIAKRLLELGADVNFESPNEYVEPPIMYIDTDDLIEAALKYGGNINYADMVTHRKERVNSKLFLSVSSTHLTLPTIYSV